MNGPVLLIVLPLLTAFLLPIIYRLMPLAGRLTGPLILVVTSIIGLTQLQHLGDDTLAIAMGGFPPPLGISLYIDRLALAFALAVTLGTLLLWPKASGDNPDSRPGSLSLILAGAGCGLALSGDLFNVYVFYELVAVATYGLVAGRGTTAACTASVRYLIISGFGAAMALIGIALIYNATGTLNLAHLAELAPSRLNNGQGLAAFVLLLIGFGVKAELFPVNTWVPEVYATASSRLTALLAGVVSKLALLIVLRLLVLLFPQPEAHLLMLVLGILGVVSGELAAWRARDLNRLLAYSSIGQLGIMFIAFSMPGQAAILAGLAVALHHLIAKPALFLLAERWGGSVQGLSGAAENSPVAAVLFILLSLSLIGVPPFPGFWAKLLVLLELARQAQPLYFLGAAVILAGAALEANYLFRVVSRLYTPDAAQPVPEPQRLPELARAGMLGAVLVASIFVISPINNQLEQLADQASDTQRYISTVNPRVTP